MINSIFFSFMFISLLACTSNQTSEQVLDPKRACQSGEIKHGYLSDCQKGVQTCLDGQWVGPTLKETCSSQNKTCDGEAEGSVRTGYLMSQMPQGSVCPRGEQKCLGGSWQGPELYSTCTEY